MHEQEPATLDHAAPAPTDPKAQRKALLFMGAFFALMILIVALAVWMK